MRAFLPFALSSVSRTRVTEPSPSGFSSNSAFVCCDDRKIIKTLMPCYDVSQEIGNARAAASAMTAAYAAELLSDSEKNYEYGLALSMGAGGTYSAVILKKA